MHHFVCIFVCAAAAISGSALQSCNTLENTAGGSTPSSSNLQQMSGTFALTSAPLLCAGNASQWRLCYFKSTSDRQSTTILGVYRPKTPSSTMLQPMLGMSVAYITVEGNSSYGCSNVNVTTPFEVMAGDVIVVCVLSETSHAHLGAAAVLPGASVQHQQQDCTALPRQIDLGTGFVSRSDLTVLVSLDIAGCGTSGLNSNMTDCNHTGLPPTTTQDTATILNHERQATEAIAASVVGIAVLVAVIATVVGIVILWHIRYRRKLRPTGNALDNMVYQEPVNSNTIINSTHKRLQTSHAPPPQGSEQMYQVIENGTNIYATLCQQVYECAAEYEDPYCLPPLHEEELYAQLENHRIQKIPRQEIRTTVTLGKGQFGDVEIGMWTNCGRVKEVAVKTLSPSSAQLEDKIKFLQEAAIMAQFKHPNVIQLYGIVTDEEPIMLVLELAHNKDLKTHVSSLRPRELVRPDLPKILLAYSKQVALGMQYLSSKSFVHCDLAARNVLVTKDYVCKIADFGLSHNLTNESYYITHGGIIPIKWTAPEAINFKKYSTASDVWSYGCLLYEIWTLGFKPFEKLSNPEAVEKVEAGYRLPPPPGCPRTIYQLMINCWNPEAHNRPAFKDIYSLLSSHESDVLAVPNEALLSHPKAGHLGAPMDAGEKMYLDLQKSYV